MAIEAVPQAAPLMAGERLARLFAVTICRCAPYMNREMSLISMERRRFASVVFTILRSELALQF